MNNEPEIQFQCYSGASTADIINRIHERTDAELAIAAKLCMAMGAIDVNGLGHLAEAAEAVRSTRKIWAHIGSKFEKTVSEIPEGPMLIELQLLLIESMVRCVRAHFPDGRN